MRNACSVGIFVYPYTRLHLLAAPSLQPNNTSQLRRLSTRLLLHSPKKMLPHGPPLAEAPYT
jgi:hypothetical protein